MFIFPVQLTTSRIGNLTRLIHTLLYVMTIHTYIHTIPNSTYDAPPKFQQMADAISAATIPAVDRHLAHLGLHPRSDFAGLAPVAPPPPPTDGCCGHHHTLLRPRTVLCCGPCSFTVHFRGPRPYSSAPPPTDGCCGPHHTPLRPRTVLCCGPCSFTVHFRVSRPCSSAPPRRTGVVDPTTHSSAPVQYSAAAPAPLQYTSAGLAPVAQPPRRTGVVDPTTHSSARVQYSAAAFLPYSTLPRASPL